jgi:DNA end-binding protein Ku
MASTGRRARVVGPARGAHQRPGSARSATQSGAPKDTERQESRPLSGATITFGLVTIPVELRTATRSLAPAFHLVHEACGSRVHQQLYCPVHKRVVERSELVRGFDVGRDQYVVFTPEELEHLEGEASRTIDIGEFVPLSAVDPIYYETTYYLSAGKEGGRAYGLLAEAMAGDARVALATFVMRGKENLVAIRAVDGLLLLHTLFFADEVRPRPASARETRASRPEEVKLARQLIEGLSSDTFAPERYEDAYRERIQTAAGAKAKGGTIAVEAPAAKPARVVDIMDALKASLERGARRATAPRPRAGRARTVKAS